MKHQKPSQLYSNLIQRAFTLFAQEGEGGAVVPPVITPELQAIIDAKVAESVTGLKAKRDELLETNRQIKDQLKGFDGVDVAKYREYQERLDKDEDARLISEGKTVEVVQKYTERMRGDFATQLADKDAAIEAERQRGKKYEQAVLDNQIRAACVGMHPSAIEDALLHGRTIFSLDAEGRAVKLDGSGRLELGKDGSNPFSPAEWIESQKEAKPHWFPATSSGSGSSGANPAGGNGGKTMSRAKFDALTPAQKAEAGRSGVQIV